MNPNNLYYQLSHSDYQPTMDKHVFHDSGIADEGLSDDTGSIEGDSHNKENRSDEHETPKKPNQSYLEIIAEAILKAPNRMMQLYEIYNYFKRKYQYFADDINKSWKNSVRHNLSLNDCFQKAGRGTNGKGHYWRIHELAERDFEQGRFRRRRYRQQMRDLQMRPSPTHQPSYETQSLSSYYPPTNPYYVPSPPPSYQSVYQNTNTPTEPLKPMPCSTPTSYAFYDPYSTGYYPSGYYPHPSMVGPYGNANECLHFDT